MNINYFVGLSTLKNTNLSLNIFCHSQVIIFMVQELRGIANFFIL